MKKIFSLNFILLAFTSSLVFSQAPSEEVPDYIQFEDDKLLTAVSRFEKEDQIIDLVSVVHIADKNYFALLNQYLTQYDAVLYEMVGGPYSEEKMKAAKTEGEMSQIQGMQKVITNMLGLEFQLDHINYAPKNFVHADMSASQFMKESNGGKILSNLMGKALQLSASGGIKGIPTDGDEANQMMMGLLGAVMSGDDKALKRTLGPILANAEELIVQLEGGEESVLIAKRNKIAMSVLEGLEQKPKRKDAILYGAAHMPDFEKRLIELGYKKTETNWFTGWDVNKEAVKADQSGPQVNELQQLINQVGSLMGKLEENSK